LIDGEDFGRTEIVVVLFNGWHFWAHVVVADGVDLPSQCNLAQILGELHFTHYVNSFFFLRLYVNSWCFCKRQYNGQMFILFENRTVVDFSTGFAWKRTGNSHV